MSTSDINIGKLVEEHVASHKKTGTLEAKLDELSGHVIDTIIEDFEHGDDTTKAGLAKGLIGPILKGLGADDTEAHLEQQRAAFVEVLEEVCGVGGTAMDVDADDDALEAIIVEDEEGEDDAATTEDQ